MDTTEETITTAAALDRLIDKVHIAQNQYATFSEEKVNAIFKAAATAANKMRIDLAETAVAETGMGVVEDKVIKNHFASEYIYNKHKKTKTCGIISVDEINGTKIVAAPLGVIAGIVPTTNPTSTAIFKSLLALKTRNGIIFSPHPRAKKSTVAAAKVVLDAAVKAGAPENIIGWINEPSIELSEMRDKTKLTRNEINLAEGNVAQDMNYRFLWYALFEPETEDADNAYEAAKGHIESNLQPTEDNPFRGETLCEKNRQYLVRIKAFSLYRYWMRSGEVPVFDREDLLISKNEGDWLPALTGKYVGALLAASGKKSEAASLFREYFGLLDEKTDPIMRFIQMTFCCEAFRSTGDESYCKRARTLVEGLREIYRRSSTLKAWDHYLQKGDAAVFPGLDYWY